MRRGEQSRRHGGSCGDGGAGARRVGPGGRGPACAQARPCWPSSTPARTTRATVTVRSPDVRAGPRCRRHAHATHPAPGWPLECSSAATTRARDEPARGGVAGGDRESSPAGWRSASTRCTSTSTRSPARSASRPATSTSAWSRPGRRAAADQRRVARPAVVAGRRAARRRRHPRRDGGRG
ncbi:hypothetical protein HBB16_01675 [Pseudonocardia sp. MCCB 268]|nr:hypothetical protein [Pseudonocardia cytotoxica]